MSGARDTEPEATPDDLPATPELAFRMGLALGRIEGLLDGMLSRLDRRGAEIAQALDARIAAEAERDAGGRTE